MPSCRYSTGKLAYRLLKLAKDDSRAMLDAELTRIRAGGDRGSGLAAERWELLQAIACGLLAAETGRSPLMPDPFIGLLRHLAGLQQQVAVRDARTKPSRARPSRSGKPACRRS
jgi:hypothetical protein